MVAQVFLPLGRGGQAKVQGTTHSGEGGGQRAEDGPSVCFLVSPDLECGCSSHGSSKLTRDGGFRVLALVFIDGIR